MFIKQTIAHPNRGILFSSVIYIKKIVLSVIMPILAHKTTLLDNMVQGGKFWI